MASASGGCILILMRTFIFLLIGLTVKTALSQGCCTVAQDSFSLGVEVQEESECCHEDQQGKSDSHSPTSEKKSHCPSPCCGAFVITGTPIFKVVPIEYEVSQTDLLSFPEIHLAALIKPPIV